MGTLNLIETDYCLVGHSHRPFICCEILDNPLNPEFTEFPDNEPVVLRSERRIINPGSVGQPRDRDSRASYAVYDSERVAIHRHRAAYEVTKAQEKMRAANLPVHLIDRLGHGI